MPKTPDPSKSSKSPAAAAPAAAREVPRARRGGAGVPAGASITHEARRAMIAEHAYLRAERRGFAAGHETEDWLAAEAEIDSLLKAGYRGSSQ